MTATLGTVHLPDLYDQKYSKGSRCGLVYGQPGWHEADAVITDQDAWVEVTCPTCLQDFTPPRSRPPAEPKEIPMGLLRGGDVPLPEDKDLG